LKLQPSPTSTHTSTSSLPAAQARELTLQSSSSLHLDPVLGSAEWLNGGRHPVDALASHQAPRLPLPYHGPVYTPTPSDGASSVYSQLGLDHIDLALPALETWTSSHENLSGEPSLLPCQTEVGLYHHNTGNVGGDSSSFEEGLQLNVLVRRDECPFMMYGSGRLTSNRTWYVELSAIPICVCCQRQIPPLPSWTF
jgi:hypothetical protein